MSVAIGAAVVVGGVTNEGICCCNSVLDWILLSRFDGITMRTVEEEDDARSASGGDGGKGFKVGSAVVAVRFMVVGLRQCIE